MLMEQPLSVLHCLYWTIQAVATLTLILITMTPYIYRIAQELKLQVVQVVKITYWVIP